MTNSKVKTTNHYKKSRLISKIGFGFLMVAGSLIVLYAGYCWGVLGRNNLLFQYFFQCKCPANSEQTRYPNNVEVIVSACQYYLSISSPSGRLLYVKENPSINSEYLLNLQTWEKTPIVLEKGSNYFLTDDLIFHSFYGDNEYILEISSSIKYPVLDAVDLQPSIYSMGNADTYLLSEMLSQSDQVFLIDDVFQPVVALTSDFRHHPENTFTFNIFDLSGDESNQVEQFLKVNKIDYYYVPNMFPHELISPNGEFIAREDGIYLFATGEKIVEGYSPSGYYRSYSGQYFSIRGWLHDNSGVLYSAFLEPCLLETNFLIFEYPGCFIKVDQPLIKLKVPQEYLDTP